MRLPCVEREAGGSVATILQTDLPCPWEAMTSATKKTQGEEVPRESKGQTEDRGDWSLLLAGIDSFSDDFMADRMQPMEQVRLPTSAPPAAPAAPPPHSPALAAALRAGDRAALGRAITLVESTLPEHRVAAEELLAALLPHAGGAIRVGITGVPGVGKSSLIERLGLMLVEKGHRVAVLAVDPSSELSGGSILGDKTRMAELARRPEAFIRPSPAGGALGGVAGRTRDCIPLLEAAGHDVVLVETVGVGQSETLVAGMVDSFLLLVLPGAGDELQGVKRGIMELADVVAVTKADGDNLARAQLARAQLQAALHLLSPRLAGWTVPVLGCSALTGEGVEALWEALLAHHRLLTTSGLLQVARRRQDRAWFESLVAEGLRARLLDKPGVAGRLAEEAEAVAAGRRSPQAAARQFLTLIDAITDGG